MAQRTLADYITERQQKRLEDIFRQELLAMPSDQGGPQRVVENEHLLRETLKTFLPGLSDPYFEFISPEIEIVTEYSGTIILQSDNLPKHLTTNIEWPCRKKGSPSRRVRLIKLAGHCPTEQTLVRTLRREGWEFADAWDVRSFTGGSPEITETPTGHSIYARATQIPVRSGKGRDFSRTFFDPKGKERAPVIAHFDVVEREWKLVFGTSRYGPTLVRRIEK